MRLPQNNNPHLVCPSHRFREGFARTSAKKNPASGTRRLICKSSSGSLSHFTQNSAFPMKIAAIIPAHNEARTICNIIYTLRRSRMVSEVIVVSDGSTDGTARVVRRCGAEVIALSKSHGKGEALGVGVAATNADILLFLDGDLIGLRQSHLAAMLEPVRKGAAAMSIGIQDRGEVRFEIVKRLPLVSGQRALRREVFERVPRELREGYQIEEAMNYLCKVNEEEVKVVHLDGVSQLQKVKKQGLLRGVWGYVKMTVQVARVMVMLRMLRLARAL